MPNVRLTWTNNSSGHDGQRVRMDAPSSEGPDTVIADIGPAAEEYIALDATEPEACFTVAAYDVGGEEESAVACVMTGDPLPDIGDEWEGGIYAGIITYADARQFHIIFGLQSSEVSGLKWDTQGRNLSIVDEDDGWQNTQDGLSAGGTMPAIDHCVGYTNDGFSDWYLGSKNEMGLEQNLRGHPEMSTTPSARRWTSTESDQFSALAIQFSDGAIFARGKTNTNQLTRPVRRIPV